MNKKQSLHKEPVLQYDINMAHQSYKCKWIYTLETVMEFRTVLH